MTRVVVVGCGVVGAAIAYELSQRDDVNVTVLDRQAPGQGATAAALGIAMAVISQKAKGRNWRLREASLKRYQTLLPELEELTGHCVPHNSQGLLSLCFDPEELPRWQSLREIRERQGWRLEVWEPQQVAAACPHLQFEALVAGIYSPQDLQVAPQALTQALVVGAQRRGATFYTHAPVTTFQRQGDRVMAVQTAAAAYAADWVVVTAGLGSEWLTQALGQPLPLMPVLGQGLRVRVPQTLGNEDFQPVVNGDDVHLVPLGNREYGVAATVEFPEAGTAEPLPRESALEAVWQGAIAYCPALAKAEILNKWYGLRPRPRGQAAPVIEPLADYANVILATGHYRNGVLLAPATAQVVEKLIFPGE